MTYPEILTAAWQQHLAPRAPGAPSVISLFAGCGGSSLGYSMAGFRELLAVEWDKNAAATFALNFPGIRIHQGDITKLTSAEIMRLAGIRPRELDVLDGSPPCQGFSTAGKRNLDDSRNQLFREYVRILQDLQPRAFVMENVSGMVKARMKLVFVDALRALRACGYRVTVQLMSTMYFNVPQNRPRLIFIGTREDQAPPSHPKPVSRVRNLRDALQGLDNTHAEILAATYPATTLCYRLLEKMKPGESGDKYHTKKTSMFGLSRLRWDRPGNTVLKGDGSGQACATCHPTENRRLTISEIKRVCSFPDEMQFIGKTGDRWARMGNSVPPLFMRAIAEHLRTQILTSTAAAA